MRYFLMVVLYFAYGQGVRQVPLVEVKNAELLSIIDSFIDHERKCYYYSKDLYIFVTILRHNQVYISSETTLWPQGEYWGCFFRDSHLVVVNGIRLDSTLFHKTDKRVTLRLYTPKRGIDPNTGLEILDYPVCGKYSYWVYFYIGGKFISDGKSTRCK